MRVFFSWSKKYVASELLFLLICISGGSYWLSSIESTTLSAFLLMLAGFAGLILCVDKLRISISVALVSAILVLGLINATGYSNNVVSQSKLVIVLVMFLLGRAWTHAPLFGGNISISVITGLSLISMLTGLRFSNGWEETMCSVFPHRNVFAFVMIGCFWWLVHIAIVKREVKILKITYGNMTVVVFCIIFSDSRAGIIAWAVSSVAFILFYLWRSAWKYIAIILIISLVILGRFGVEGGGRSIVNEPLSAINGGKGNINGGGASSAGRIQYWKATWSSWKNSPIMGNGEGSVRYGLEAYRMPSESASLDVIAGSSHNHYLEILHDRGILGLSLELSVLAWAMIAVYKRKEWALLSCLLGLSLQSIVAAESEFPVSVALWWWCIGYSLRYDMSLQRFHISYGKILFSALFTLGIYLIWMHSLVLRADWIAARAFLNKDVKNFHVLMNRSGELDPNSSVFLYNAAAYYLNSGNYDEAKMTLDIMKKRMPGFRKNDFIESGYLRAVGDVDSSVLVLENLHSIYPNDSYIIEHLINVLISKNDSLSEVRSKNLLQQYVGMYNKCKNDLKVPYLNRHTIPKWVPQKTVQFWDSRENARIEKRCIELRDSYFQLIKNMNDLRKMELDG